MHPLIVSLLTVCTNCASADCFEQTSGGGWRCVECGMPTNNAGPMLLNRHDYRAYRAAFDKGD